MVIKLMKVTVHFMEQKVDIMVQDALNHVWQTGTIQPDF